MTELFFKCNRTFLSMILIIMWVSYQTNGDHLFLIFWCRGRHCRFGCGLNPASRMVFPLYFLANNCVAPEREGSSPCSQEPATGPYPDQPNPSPPPQANLPMIHSDPNLSSMPWSSKRSLSFGLSHQNLVHFSLLSHACHMPRPPHSP
jgi:hypothetical protein